MILTKADLDKLLVQVHQAGGSDLHLCVGIQPAIRRNGRLESITSHILTEDDMKAFQHILLSAEKFNAFLADGDADAGYTCIADDLVLHCRANVFKDNNGLSIALRLFPDHIPSMDELRLPTSVRKLITEQHGLIIICGPTGHGKTTTLAAMVNAINENQDVRIISIEDPVEYIIPMKRAVISQREVGRDCRDFYHGLRTALRGNPNIIVAGEARDPDTIFTALAAAETGHLVFTTLHAGTVVEAMDRLIQYFPAERHQEIRNELATSLRAVIAQRLIPSKRGGLVAAFEVLLMTDAIKNLIRTGKGYQFKDYMHPEMGMQSMEQSMVGLRNLHLIK